MGSVEKLLRSLYYTVLVYKDFVLYYYRRYNWKEVVTQDMLVEVYQKLCELEKLLEAFR